MSTQAQNRSWDAARTTVVPVAIHQWLARRRIAISLVGFSVLIFFNVCIKQTVPHNPIALYDPWVQVSMALVGLGLAIRSWSAGTLNKFRELTTIGPYALIRNPLYVGSFMIMLGFCILCRDWPTMAFVIGPLSILYWLQVCFEEERLSSSFPAQWPSYSSSTPRFIPRRFSRDAFTGWSLFEWMRNREYNTLAASTIGIMGVLAWYLILTRRGQ